MGSLADRAASSDFERYADIGKFDAAPCLMRGDRASTGDLGPAESVAQSLWLVPSMTALAKSILASAHAPVLTQDEGDQD